MNVISLFAGIGGICQGFKNARFRLNDALIYSPDNFYFYDSNNEWNEDITRDLVQLPNY